MQRLTRLAICGCLTAAACVLEDPKETPEGPDSDGTSGGAESSEAGSSSESTGAPGGCTMTLEDVREHLTIPAGCVVDVPVLARVSEGATLTIEAGATLRFGPESGLAVGVDSGCDDDDDCTGSLVASGSAAEPIVFTSAAETPGPGDWLGIQFGRWAAAGSAIDHAVLSYAGAQSRGAVEILDNDDIPAGRVSLDNSRLEHNAGPGLIVDLNRSRDAIGLPFLASLAGNTFADPDGLSVLLDVNVVGDIGEGNTFSAPIGVDPGWFNFVSEATWSDHAAPYRMFGNLQIAHDDGAVLELTAGVAIEFPLGAELQVGDLFDPGALRATETAFYSAASSPTAGDWEGIKFTTDTAPSSLLGCTISHALGSGAEDRDGVVSFPQGHSEDIVPLVEIVGTTFADNAGLIDIYADTEQEGPEICAPYVAADTTNVFDLLPCE